jgi:serine/threonine protein kinase
MNDHLHEGNVFVKVSKDYLQLLKKKTCVRISDFMAGNQDTSYDMWKFGVILAKIILAGSRGEYISARSFDSIEHDSASLIKRVQSAEVVYSLQLINLCVALLNPKQRPTAKFVLESTFINSFLKQSIELIRPRNLIEIEAGNIIHVKKSIDAAIRKAEPNSVSQFISTVNKLSRF